MSRLQHAALITFVAIIGVIACNTADSTVTQQPTPETTVSYDTSYKSDLRTKGLEAATFCKNNQMETQYCLLLHMGRHSGYHRFFIWDMQQQRAIDSGMVSHGCGENNWGEDHSADNPSFSNTYDTHLSSLGKYKIGKRGYSQWGIHVNYLMHGLDSTNNHALGRSIVLHSWSMIPDTPVYPEGTPEGWGCPAVSNTFMYTLDERLQKSEKPVLMWMFQ
jgi:hypothetical protein